MRKRVSSHANFVVLTCARCTCRHPAVVLPAAAGGGSSRSSRTGASATRDRSRRRSDAAGGRREGARRQGRRARRDGKEGRRRWPQRRDRLAGRLRLRLPLLDGHRVGCEQRGERRWRWGWRWKHEAAVRVQHVVRVRARHLLAATARGGTWATGSLTAAATTAVDGECAPTKALAELLAEHCSTPALRHRFANSPVHINDNCRSCTRRSSPARAALEAHDSAALAIESSSAGRQQ